MECENCLASIEELKQRRNDIRFYERLIHDSLIASTKMMFKMDILEAKLNGDVAKEEIIKKLASSYSSAHNDLKDF